MMTPFEKFKSIPEVESDLKKGDILKKLDAIDAGCSDNEAAPRLNVARANSFNQSTNPNNAPPEQHLTKPLRPNSCLDWKILPLGDAEFFKWI
ncbi:MAG: hypothetical protein HY016_06605 [Nitrosomonadales bacterium]|nr:hypothetical protein [Nitrosomonadales bacterium]